MSKSKGQHWVPRFYLRYFATAETRDSSIRKLWVFSKNGGNPELQNIEKIAKSNHLYTPKKKDGSRDWKTDNMFDEIEACAGVIWPRLSEEFVNLYGEESLRKFIALFVATCYLRSQGMVQQTEEIHRQLIDFYEQIPKDEHGNPAISAVRHQGNSRPFDSAEYQKYKNAGPDAIRQMFVDSIRGNAVWLAEALLEKRWSVVFADEPVFVTTDTPVIIMNRNGQNSGIRAQGPFSRFLLVQRGYCSWMTDMISRRGTITRWAIMGRHRSI